MRSKDEIEENKRCKECGGRLEAVHFGDDYTLEYWCRECGEIYVPEEE